MTEAIPTKNRTACRLVRRTQPGAAYIVYRYEPPRDSGLRRYAAANGIAGYGR
jgi:hypothetical protein